MIQTELELICLIGQITAESENINLRPILLWEDDSIVLTLAGFGIG